MTIPKFTLTKHITLNCIRVLPGSYVKGKYIPGAEVEFQIEGNVQPLRYHDQQLLKESDRSKEWITIYSASNLRGLEEGDSGYEGDVVIWNGYRYRVMKTKRYQMSILDHCQAQAAREELTPTSV